MAHRILLSQVYKCGHLGSPGFEPYLAGSWPAVPLAQPGTAVNGARNFPFPQSHQWDARNRAPNGMPQPYLPEGDPLQGNEPYLTLFHIFARRGFLLDPPTPLGGPPGCPARHATKVHGVSAGDMGHNESLGYGNANGGRPSAANGPPFNRA